MLSGTLERRLRETGEPIALVALAILSIRHLDGLISSHLPQLQGAEKQFLGLVFTLSSPGVLAAGAIMLFLHERFERENPERASKAFLVSCAILVAASLSMLLQLAAARHAPFLMTQTDPTDFVFFTLAADRQSFPSIETASLFALAGTLAALVPRHEIHFWCAAALLASVGVLTERCWFSDALIGGELGAEVAYLMSRLLGRAALIGRRP